jgi:hypothetical protein
MLLVTKSGSDSSPTLYILLVLGLNNGRYKKSRLNKKEGTRKARERERGAWRLVGNKSFKKQINFW